MKFKFGKGKSWIVLTEKHSTAHMLLVLHCLGGDASISSFLL